MLAIRADDGSSLMVEGPGATDPGSWIPTPPGFLPPLAPQWPQVTPFVLRSGDQFRPPPPPALDSPEYAAALNEVKAIGGTVSAVRTAEQAAIGHFWADVPGSTFTPPGHWNQIAANAARSRRLGPLQTARMFATLNTALADAAICCWDAKYHHNFWRPVTAIRSADTDGSPETTADPNWTPLWETPNFPAYTSGHSTFSGAAQVVLERFFGKSFAFVDRGDPTQNLKPRIFRNFAQAAEEAGVSRIYGGIHFRFDNTVGLEGGRIVGNEVLTRFGSTSRIGGRA